MLWGRLAFKQHVLLGRSKSKPPWEEEVWGNHGKMGIAHSTMQFWDVYRTELSQNWNLDELRVDNTLFDSPNFMIFL